MREEDQNLFKRKKSPQKASDTQKPRKELRKKSSFTFESINVKTRIADIRTLIFMATCLGIALLGYYFKYYFIGEEDIERYEIRRTTVLEENNILDYNL